MTAGGTTTIDVGKDPVLQGLIHELVQTLGARLKSVVLYGSAARGDYQPGASDLNVIVVLESLSPAMLEAVSPALRRFVRKNHPPPRLFTPELIASSVDSFPVEFVDIWSGRMVLHGPDPFLDLVVPRDKLRLQIERELKEKTMRLREGYILAHDNAAGLTRLLVESYPAFGALFRGGLHLMGKPAPRPNHEVVASFCEAAGLDRAPFLEVARLRQGEKGNADPKVIFARYYDQLMKAADGVDRLVIQGGETT